MRRHGNGDAYYDHLDAQSSALVQTAFHTGNVVWRELYTPFGEKTVDAPASRDDAGYTGHVQDDLSGLTYMQARYYDPVVGRFLSTDPIGYQDQFNLYAYVGNDPVNAVDPTGEFAAALPFVGPHTPVVANPVGAAVAIVAVGVAGTIADDSTAGITAGAPCGCFPIGEAMAAATLKNEATDQKLGEILDGAQKGRTTKGKSEPYYKPGGMDQANEDFDKLADPETVKDRGEGLRTGETPDGRKLTVRPGARATEGLPTVDVKRGRKTVKIRYTENTEVKED